MHARTGAPPTRQKPRAPKKSSWRSPAGSPLILTAWAPPPAIENVGPLTALAIGWRVVRALLGESLLVWVINLGIALAAGTAVAAGAGLVAAVPGGLGAAVVAGWVGAALVGYAAVAALAVLAIGLVLAAVSNIFLWCYWTLACLRLGLAARAGVSAWLDWIDEPLRQPPQLQLATVARPPLVGAQVAQTAALPTAVPPTLAATPLQPTSTSTSAPRAEPSTPQRVATPPPTPTGCHAAPSAAGGTAVAATVAPPPGRQRRVTNTDGQGWRYGPGDSVRP